MDINKKLSYYRTQKQSRHKASIPASLQAIAEATGGHILFEQAPVLKITRYHDFDFTPQVHLPLLSRGQLDSPLNVQDLLFFDLETTGLAGGAGTFPFLLGIGFFEDSRFCVEIYFLPDYGREYLLFKTLTQQLESFKSLVSYNGKSYDLPLLKNRFVLNRIKFDWDRFGHLDLLHMARRIWKDSFDSLELTNIEQHILNRRREEDIPGALIPQAYFKYLQTGVIHEIIQIIEHNFLDIISLAELLDKLSSIEKDPQLLNDSAALIRLAGLAYEQGKLRELQTLETILEKHNSKPQPAIWIWKSLLAKRAGDWKTACTYWNKLLDNGQDQFFALCELAKYYEHRQRDYRRALTYTERALQIGEKLCELNPYAVAEDIVLAFQKRANRLSKKLT